MSKFTFTYEDGEETITTTANGKLSLLDNWAYVLDTTRPTPVIVLAIPTRRIIDIQETGK